MAMLSGLGITISNAGVPGGGGGPEAPDESWDEAWRVNVMAHVWAARELLPQMRARGEGYLISTASASFCGARPALMISCCWLLRQLSLLPISDPFES